MNDEHELLRVLCPCCGIFNEGTYAELFGDLPSLRCLPELVCSECKVTLRIEYTGRYVKFETLPNKGFEEQMAYPQYAEKYQGKEIVISALTLNILREFVLKLKSEADCYDVIVSPEVQKHWNCILDGKVPFDIKIVR